MSRTRWLRFLLLFALLALAGCDRTANQPATLQATLQEPAGAPAAGGALVFISGAGLGAVEGVGGTLVWTHTPAGEEGGVRLLLVQPDNALPIRFTVRVERRGDPQPRVTVLDLTGRDNQRIADPARYTVRFE